MIDREAAKTQVTPKRIWSAAELEEIGVTYSERHPDEFRAYLEWEDGRGYLSEEMVRHLEAHVAMMFPDLNQMDHTRAVVDFRFAQEHRRKFAWWQPEHQAERLNAYIAFRHGRAGQGLAMSRYRFIAWSDDDKVRFITYMKQARPELWAEYIEQVRAIGWCGGLVREWLMTEYRNFFAFPEDLTGDPYWGYDVSGSSLIVIDPMTDEKEQFKRAYSLSNSWLAAKKKGVSFEDWLENTNKIIEKNPGNWSIIYE